MFSSVEKRVGRRYLVCGAARRPPRLQMARDWASSQRVCIYAPTMYPKSYSLLTITPPSHTLRQKCILSFQNCFMLRYGPLCKQADTAEMSAQKKKNIHSTQTVRPSSHIPPLRNVPFHAALSNLVSTSILPFLIG